MQLRLLHDWVASGKAISTAVDQFQLTMAALRSYRVCVALDKPEPTFCARLDLEMPVGDRTTLEMFLLLKRDGGKAFDFSIKPMSAGDLKSLRPYKKGEDKAFGFCKTMLPSFHRSMFVYCISTQNSDSESAWASSLNDVRRTIQ